ncbi:MAG TPA: hypothetical protein VGG20_14790 [Thermoanaerobaculia bacterium]|jgi:hypothetical protein
MATLAELIAQRSEDVENLRGRIQVLESTGKRGDMEAAQSLRSQMQVRENDLAGLLARQARRGQE